jgi:hypothetical protein
MNQITKEVWQGALLKKIKYETKIFGNISFILDKMQNDGHFCTVETAFMDIFHKEMTFAVSGRFDQN